MRYLKPYFDYLAAFDPAEDGSLDRGQNLLVIGALLSARPRRVLELGIGTGHLTVSMLYALRHNGQGKLTCVDDWSAWGGAEPEGISAIRDAGVKMVAPVSAAEFLAGCGKGAFDFVVADAAFVAGGQALERLCRAAADAALVFLRNPERLNGNGRAGLEERLRRQGMFCRRFDDGLPQQPGLLLAARGEGADAASAAAVGLADADRVGAPDKERACVRGAAVHPAQETLYLGLVPGENYGWGVCSRYLIAELSQRVPCRVLNAEDGSDRNPELDGPLFQALTGVDFFPMFEAARGRRNFGYTFFENELTRHSVENAKRFDLVLGGSSWCRDRMREKGIDNCEVLIQGIDQRLYHPIAETREAEEFVIFSGGKFELRKGQDLVLRAIKILQQKYRDIVLVNCWYNLWPESMKPMAHSPHIRFEYQKLPWPALMERVYVENGLDPERIRTMELVPKELHRALYAQTDLGVFPNRCEGGTNLVMMEYMACGKPVVASYTSGHTDILTEENALLLKDLAPFRIAGPNDELIARWEEPSLDELVAQIEYAYLHREVIRKIGRKAGESLKRFTWANCAERLLEIVQPAALSKGSGDE